MRNCHSGNMGRAIRKFISRCSPYPNREFPFLVDCAPRNIGVGDGLVRVVLGRYWLVRPKSLWWCPAKQSFLKRGSLFLKKIPAGPPYPNRKFSFLADCALKTIGIGDGLDRVVLGRYWLVCPKSLLWCPAKLSFLKHGSLFWEFPPAGPPYPNRKFFFLVDYALKTIAIGADSAPGKVISDRWKSILRS